MANNRFLIIVFDVMLVLSGVVASCFLFNSGYSAMAEPLILGINAVLAAAVLVIVILKYRPIEMMRRKFSLGTLAGAILLSVEIVRDCAVRNARLYEGFGWRESAGWGVGASSVFAVTVGMFFVIVKICDFVKDLKISKNESIFLGISWIVMAILIFGVYSSTNIFYNPTNSEGEFFYCDVVYTSDSGAHSDQDVFANVGADENDLRQPFFGIFALPFAAAARILAQIFWFVPFGYSLFLQVIQVGLLLLAIVLLERLVRARSPLFYLFFMATFSFCLFSLLKEQYIFSFFWLILAIYSWITAEGRDVENLYIAATGSLVTSAVLLPLVLCFNSLKKSLRAVWSVLLKTFAVVILFARIPVFYLFARKIRWFTTFTGVKISIGERILQYLTFLQSCFTFPKSVVEEGFYRLAPVGAVSVVGIAVLAAVIAGFALNWRERIARVAAWWSLFSMVLLCLVGWGTSENGLVLYALYFSWAFVVLIWLLIKRIPVRWARVSVIVGLICLMLAVNVVGMVELLRFGVQYYPARI